MCNSLVLVTNVNGKDTMNNMTTRDAGELFLINTTTSSSNTESESFMINIDTVQEAPSPSSTSWMCCWALKEESHQQQETSSTTTIVGHTDNYHKSTTCCCCFTGGDADEAPNNGSTAMHSFCASVKD